MSNQRYGRVLLGMMASMWTVGCVNDPEFTTPKDIQYAADSGVQSSLKLAPKTLTVMTLNVRIPEDKGDNAWKNRVGRLAKMIKTSNFGAGTDVIGIQELRAETHEDLLSRLPEYKSFPIDRGDGEVMAIFTRRRLEVTDKDFKDVQRRSRDGHCSRVYADRDRKNRPIMHVVVKDPDSGLSTMVVNTHFPSGHSCERRGMSEKVASYIKNESNGVDRVVFLGDVNDGVEPNGRFNGSFEKLIDLTGMKIAFAQHHALDSTGAFSTHNGFKKEERVGRMIDHVLVSNNIRVVDSDIDRTMFTKELRSVPCERVRDGRCADGTPLSDVFLYSDHWAVTAFLE